MPFQAQVGQELIIEGVPYHVAEHPSAPSLPYGQEGRQAVVYQLIDQEGTKHALKVFKSRYRVPALVSLADRLEHFSRLPGLSVCCRTVLSARRHGDLLRQHPDLTYAVLMPWIEGPTWMQVMLEKRALPAQQSLDLARSLAEVLAAMEEQGLAHCDLSASNLLLPGLEDVEGLPVALVDVEQFYGPGLERPELLPGGSPGYAHKRAPKGLWSSSADRFGGAVLLSEMLGWCDSRVREAAWGENYFDPSEMQQDGDRYRVLAELLSERWGDRVLGLFDAAWRSEVLADCATFGEWLVTLPREVPVRASFSVRDKPDIDGEPESAREAGEAVVRALMDVARRLEALGNREGALENYRQAQMLASPGSGLAEELALIVKRLEGDEETLDVHPPEPELRVDEGPEISVSSPRSPEREQRLDSEPAPASSIPDSDGSDLDALFDAGFAAYQREEWPRAQELLAEVVRQRPDIERDGKSARDLLATASRQPARSHGLTVAKIASGALGIGIGLSLPQIAWVVITGFFLTSSEFSEGWFLWFVFVGGALGGVVLGRVLSGWRRSLVLGLTGGVGFGLGYTLWRYALEPLVWELEIAWSAPLIAMVCIGGVGGLALGMVDGWRKAMTSAAFGSASFGIASLVLVGLQPILIAAWDSVGLVVSTVVTFALAGAGLAVGLALERPVDRKVMLGLSASVLVAAVLLGLMGS